MSGNTIGQIFRVTTFGESHGAAIGGIIDGCPAGITLDRNAIIREMQRRKPGQSDISTPRKEEDEFEILSGIFEDVTTGAPVGFILRNNDYKSSDYDAMKKTFRPSHADFTYTEKYGFRDHRGGGRSSARETASRVFAGAVAKQLLKDISITAYVSSVGKISVQKNYNELDLSLIENNIVRCPDIQIAERMVNYISELKQSGDSTGGIITCVVKNCTAGLGEPVFDKLHADIGKAMLSINAVHGFEFGSGFSAAEMKGSEHNDKFEKESDGKIKTKTNYSGGIQGGISNGMDIYFRVVFKPVSTIKISQKSIDKDGREINIENAGRHDPCVVPRAVPIVEAMAAITLADHFLRNRTSKI